MWHNMIAVLTMIVLPQNTLMLSAFFANADIPVMGSLPFYSKSASIPQESGVSLEKIVPQIMVSARGRDGQHSLLGEEMTVREFAVDLAMSGKLTQ